MVDLIRNYIFDLKGEALRALIITVLGAVIQTAYHSDLSTVTDWKAWGISVAIAGLNAGVAFIFGRIPPSKPIT